MTAVPSKRFLVALGAITAAAALLRVGWLWGTPPTGDDYDVVWTATGYALHGLTLPTMPHHPVLRNLLVYASTRVFGGSVIGTVGWSLLFGVLLVAVTGLLVRRITRDERAGLFAAGLVGLDIVQIVYSRQGVNDVHAALFAVLGCWLTVEALRADDRRSWRWLVPVAGVSFGLGAASKFYALPLAAVCALLLLKDAWSRRRADDALLTAASLAPLPFTIYFLTYLPWFGRGYDLPEWWRYQTALIEAMSTFSRPPIGVRANDKAALWFVQPFYALSEVAFVSGHQAAYVSLPMGDPVIWLAVLPAVVFSLFARGQRSRDGLLLLFFLASYLPLVVGGRQIWVLSSVVVIPFAAGILASVVSGLMRRFGARVGWVYGALAVSTSLLLYPLAIGRALDVPYLQPIVRSVGDYLAPYNFNENTK